MAEPSRMAALPFLAHEPREGRIYARRGKRELLRSEYGTAEDLSVAANQNIRSEVVLKPRLAITYFGAAKFQIGRMESIIDANRVLFIPPGDSFNDCEIGLPRGRSAVVITLEPAVCEDGAFGCAFAPDYGRATISAPASQRARILAQSLLNLDSMAVRSLPLAHDELLLETAIEVLGRAAIPPRMSSSRIVDRAKEYLHSLPDDSAIDLGTVANEVGCSPIYLTQCFQRSEGIPLYRYHLRLRLNSALLHLRQCADITRLAFELGFSSHSHFTSSFRTAFGMSPSRYRTLINSGEGREFRRDQNMLCPA